jgi:hypothetical protein
MERFIDGDGPSGGNWRNGSAVIPVVAGYVLLTLALIAMWQQGSVEGIGIVAAFVLGLTALSQSGFTRFKPNDPGVGTEIERIIERIEAAATVAVDPVSPGETVETPDEETREAEAERRRALELLVRDAATWGWLKANLGSPTPPEPQLVWDRDSNARLVYDDPAALRRQVRGRHDPSAVEKARAIERSRREHRAGGPPGRPDR